MFSTSSLSRINYRVKTAGFRLSIGKSFPTDRQQNTRGDGRGQVSNLHTKGFKKSLVKYLLGMIQINGLNRPGAGLGDGLNDTGGSCLPCILWLEENISGKIR